MIADETFESDTFSGCLEWVNRHYKAFIHEHIDALTIQKDCRRTKMGKPLRGTRWIAKVRFEKEMGI